MFVIVGRRLLKILVLVLLMLGLMMVRMICLEGELLVVIPAVVELGLV
jgi:hypothetical protein